MLPKPGPLGQAGPQGSVEFGRNSLASGMICRGVDFRPEMPYKGGHDRYRLRNLQLPVGPCAAC